MDFERIATRALFYDMPVEKAVNRIRKCDSKGFIEDFCTVAKWIDESFTSSEIELLGRGMDESWISIDNKKLHNEPTYKRCLTLFSRISGMLLKLDQGNSPIVDFCNLLRWRSITRYLGEDVLTTAYTASHDFTRNNDRNDFGWNDVLHHNYGDLNEELSKGLSDVHAHYRASASIFALNWISMMNTIVVDNEYNRMQQPQSVFFDLSEHYDMRTLSIAACFLRLELYKIILLNYPIDKTKLYDIWRIFDDIKYRNDQISDIRAGVRTFHEYCFKDITGNIIDYAIHNYTNLNPDVNILHFGERKLFYTAFRKLLEGNGKIWEIAGFLYLYILIKNKIRREYEQTNKLNGFKNFKYYQDRKSKITVKHDILEKNYSKFVIQSCLENNNDMVELRTMNGVDFKMFEHASRSIGSGKKIISNLDERLSFVISFGKEEYDKQLAQNKTVRYYSLRRNVKDKYLEFCKIHSKFPPFKIGGIDAAGNELQCRPEVFSHVYRFARYMGLHGLTYHVGEDFYDLIDGLRAVDEAMRFLDLGNRCRLGHALALGVDSDKYYSKRRMNTVLPRQNLLDNLVWLHHILRSDDINVPESLLQYLEEKAMSLAFEIGYKNYNIISYWNSWLLRGDDIFDCDPKRPNDVWAITSESHDLSAKTARNDDIARKLYQYYLVDVNVKQKGNVIVEEKLPATLVSAIPQIQGSLIRKVVEKGIAIECNPSSNLHIGPFEKYIDLPLFKFNPVESDEHTTVVNVSVNTDDRGVFATSIYNEYSLIAAALYKMKDKYGNRLYNDQTIIRYIGKIRENGFKQRF